MIDELLARRPEVDFEPELGAATIEEFHERGFTSVPRITSDEELAWLAELYDWRLAGASDLIPSGPYGSLKTRRAFSRRNFGQTSSLNGTDGSSAKMRSRERPIGK